MKLHLGCGSNVLHGWSNLDLQAFPGALAADLSKPLNFEANSVNFIYSQHFIEHLDEVDGFNLLKECFRVLKTGAVMRLCCPDLEQYVQAYLNWNREKAKSANSSLFENGANFLNFAFFGEALPELKFFNTRSTNDGHKYHYDYQDLSQKLLRIGFSKVERQEFKKSAYPELSGLENRITRNLIIEAVK